MLWICGLCGYVNVVDMWVVWICECCGYVGCVDILFSVFIIYYYFGGLFTWMIGCVFLVLVSLLLMS
jgi:hypothetical protein